jgi:hypothetical protein
VDREGDLVNLSLALMVEREWKLQALLKVEKGFI